MNKRPFVHLHLHTCYSLLDGASRIDDIMTTAATNDMPAVAITDHGVMYGIVDFYQSAIKHGIRPLLGCETYVAAGSHLDRKSEGGKAPMNHLVLLALDDTGYHNLVKLVSIAHLNGFYYKPRIDKELLAAHSRGLLGLSACLKGGVTQHLAQDDLAGATQAAMEYADILGPDNFFIEIQDHGLPEQRRANKHMKALSKATGLPLVATNDVHYVEKDHAAAHEILLCLQTQTVMSDPKRMRYRTNEFFMKTRAEMDRVFKEFPGAVDITNDIAERCNVELEFGKLHFPTFHAPDGLDQREYLRRLGDDGLRRCYGVAKPRTPKDSREQEIVDRFDLELDVIQKTGFVNYFLVVWDFIRFARECRIPVGPGRGSGGGSLIAYVLGITTIDPLQYGLIFERFLNPERVSPPDFDIDFCQARRGEVIEYVKDKYGRENVAQIITFGSLGAKTVIRDVGRVLEIPYEKCDSLSKMVPDDPKIKLKNAMQVNPDFKKAYETDEESKRILDFGFVLEGLYRNPGTHAAGVVIGERPLAEIIPLARDKDGEPVTQYPMEPLGEIGLLKMDFLGLKTLTVIQETLDLIAKATETTLDLAQIPFDDEAAYALLNRGDTIGVFQLESQGMRDLIRRVGIHTIEDLIAMIALYRPGPMNMLDDYVNRKTGKASIEYDHPLLEPILKETYGVMLYQEQVQRAANVLAGYSLGEADILRRAMGKKKAEVMEKQRTTFVKGCRECHKIDSTLAGRIFDAIAKFAGYGFNKAHSAGYGIIAYQTAYLKANYPAEFMAALLSSEIGNFDKLPIFIAEAEQMGLAIGAPNVSSSGVRFTPGEGTILYGLAGIKNVGGSAAQAVIEERERNGPYAGLVDFCSRIDTQQVNRKVVESLVRCGAFDTVEPNRARLFEGIGFALARAADVLRDRHSGQGNLFDLLEEGGGDPLSEDLPPAEPWHESEALAGEKELLGLYMSGHPLTRYAHLLERYQLGSVQGLDALEDGTDVRIGGIVSQVTKRVTKTGKKPMAIAQVDDLDGSVEVVVFPEAFLAFGAYIQQDGAVLICGEVSKRDDRTKVIAHEIYPLADAPKHFATRLGLHVPAAGLKADRLERVKDILRLHPGPTQVTICVQFPSGEKAFVDTDHTFNVLADEELVHILSQELGETSVYVAVKSSPYKQPKPVQPRWRQTNAKST